MPYHVKGVPAERPRPPRPPIDWEKMLAHLYHAVFIVYALVFIMQAIQHLMSR